MLKKFFIIPCWFVEGICHYWTYFYIFSRKPAEVPAEVPLVLVSLDFPWFLVPRDFPGFFIGFSSGVCLFVFSPAGF